MSFHGLEQSSRRGIQNGFSKTGYWSTYTTKGFG